MEIVISDSVVKKIEEFAEKRTGGSADLYKSRGESRKEKVFNDIVIGCLGEYGVYQHLKSLGRKCSKPDLKIYKRGEKSFAADLSSEDLDVHVKSQSTASAKRYGDSYLCQRHDKLVSEPKETDLMAFTCVDLESNTVTLLGFTFATEILRCGLWDECRVPSYRRTKVALYLTNFEEYGILRDKL